MKMFHAQLRAAAVAGLRVEASVAWEGSCAAEVEADGADGSGSGPRPGQRLMRQL